MGRGTFRDEARLSVLFSTAYNKVIWALKASDKEVPMEIKIDLAGKVLVKMLPQNLSVEGISNIMQIIIPLSIKSQLEPENRLLNIPSKNIPSKVVETVSQ